MERTDGEVLREIAQGLKDVNAHLGRLNGTVATIKGTVNEHGLWIAIRNDREAQASKRSNISRWAIGLALTVGVAVVAMLVTILAQGGPHT